MSTPRQERRKKGFAKKMGRLMAELKDEVSEVFVAKGRHTGLTVPKLRKEDLCPKCRNGIMINGNCTACGGTGKSRVPTF